MTAAYIVAPALLSNVRLAAGERIPRNTTKITLFRPKQLSGRE
jgi:hypothetical protein